MKRKLSLMAAILICGIMCTTCDLLNDLLKDNVKEPEVTLKSVDFINIDFNGLTLLSKVDVKNNNSIDIPLPKIDWDLSIINKPFINGIIQSNSSLEAMESTEVEFPVNFTFVNLINAIVALSDENTRKDALYKINMTVQIPVPQLGNLSWSFDHEGKVPLMNIPDIKFETPPKASITKNSLGLPTGGKVDFALNVKNNSNIAVTLNKLAFALKINNFSFPEGGVTEKQTINAGATARIPFNFSLSDTDIINIGLALLTGGEISSYSLTGDYKLGIPEFPFISELGDTFTLQK